VAYFPRTLIGAKVYLSASRIQAYGRGSETGLANGSRQGDPGHLEHESHSLPLNYRRKHRPIPIERVATIGYVDSWWTCRESRQGDVPDNEDWVGHYYRRSDPRHSRTRSRGAEE